MMKIGLMERQLFEKKQTTHSSSSDDGSSFIARERVEQELISYLHSHHDDLDTVKSDKVLKFLQREVSRRRFPVLARAASSILSTKSSAAAIERAFCAASDVMSRKRARLARWVVEVPTRRDDNSNLFACEVDSAVMYVTRRSTGI